MKNLVIVSVPTVVTDQWSLAVRKIIVSIKWLIAGNCHVAELMKESILPSFPSQTLQLNCSTAFRDVASFAGRFTGGSGILIVRREVARSFVVTVLGHADISRVVAPGCTAESDVMLLTMLELGGVLSMRAASSNDQLHQAEKYINGNRTSEQRLFQLPESAELKVTEVSPLWIPQQLPSATETILALPDSTDTAAALAS